MKEAKTTDPGHFGMAREEIIAVADELSQQSDKNSPTISGSHEGFLKTVSAGHKALAGHKGYYKAGPEGGR